MNIISFLLIILAFIFGLYILFGGEKHPYIGFNATDLKTDLFYFDRLNQTPNVSHDDKYISAKETVLEDSSQQIVRKSKWKRQEECCQILEELTQAKFQRDIRPTFLRNPETGYALELDCYNAELGIALEYNGEQHYHYPNAFHRSENEWVKQVRRDRYKVEACDRNNIYLITVPYNVTDLRQEILIQLNPIMEEITQTCTRF